MTVKQGLTETICDNCGKRWAEGSTALWPPDRPDGSCRLQFYYRAWAAAMDFCSEECLLGYIQKVREGLGD